MFGGKVFFKLTLFSTVLLLPCWARHAAGIQKLDSLQNTLLADENDNFRPTYTTVLSEDGGDVEVLSDDNSEEEDVSSDPLTMAYLEADEENFIGEIDILADHDLVHKVFGYREQRQKRWVTVAGRALFTAGRTLFRSVSRTGTTRSGVRLTRQYSKSGNFGTATRDFRSLNPSNVRPFQSRTASGYTGNLGSRYRVTVRDRSSSGRPTLEVRQTNPSGAHTVRKVRYGSSGQ